MNKAQFITTSSGERLVVLSEDDYEALLDAADANHAQKAMDSVRRGDMELLSSDDLDAFLNAPTPLAFWRARRGLTQVALAKEAGISQSYLASLEKGNRKGDPALFSRLSCALNVPMEALVVEGE